MRFGAILLLAATALSSAAALPAGALAAESTMGATAAANAIPPGFAARPDGLVHIASGMVFPRQLGNATLLGQKAYDQTGDYVALLYRIPLSDGTAAIVRIGMVQLPGMTAREHYDSRRPGLLAMLPGAMPIEEAPLPFDLSSEPVHMAVEGKDQRPEFALHGVGVERLELVGCTVADFLAQSKQRRQFARNPKPDRNDSGDNQCSLLKKAPSP